MCVSAGVSVVTTCGKSWNRYVGTVSDKGGKRRWKRRKRFSSKSAELLSASKCIVPSQFGVPWWDGVRSGGQQPGHQLGGPGLAVFVDGVIAGNTQLHTKIFYRTRKKWVASRDKGRVKPSSCVAALLSGRVAQAQPIFSTTVHCTGPGVTATFAPPTVIPYLPAPSLVVCDYIAAHPGCHHTALATALPAVPEAELLSVVEALQKAGLVTGCGTTTTSSGHVGLLSNPMSSSVGGWYVAPGALQCIASQRESIACGM